MALQNRSDNGQHELGVNAVKGAGDVHAQQVGALLTGRAQALKASRRRPPSLQKWFQTSVGIVVAKHG